MAKKKKVADMDQLSTLYEQEIAKEFPEMKQDKNLAKRLKKVFDSIVNFKLEDHEKILEKIKCEMEIELSTKIKADEDEKNAFQNYVIKGMNSGKIVGPTNVHHVIMSNMNYLIERDKKQMQEAIKKRKEKIENNEIEEVNGIRVVDNTPTHKLNAKRLLQRFDKPIDEKIFAGVM